MKIKQGKYLISGIVYTAQPTSKGRIYLEVVKKNGSCHFGGCRVEKDIEYLDREDVTRLGNHEATVKQQPKAAAQPQRTLL